MGFYQNKKNYPLKKYGMTFIEVLIVIAIVSMLFSLFFYMWNALDLFRKARDSKRLNDLNLLNSAIQSILDVQSDTYLGDENVIYLSLPDSSSTCGSYDLVKIYPPYSYKCQTEANFLKIDGTGWLPVNLTLSKILGISVLPIDPLNNKDYFYAYLVKGGRYKLTAKFESNAYISKMANDVGSEPTLYEVGSNLKIPSPQSGLVGYWPLDEGTGTIANDLSGYGNNGTLQNGPTWVDGKVGKALSFDGVDDYVTIPLSVSLKVPRDITVLAWGYNSSSLGCRALVSTDYCNGEYQIFVPCGDNQMFVQINECTSGPRLITSYTETNVWNFWGLRYDGSRLRAYKNANLFNSVNYSTSSINYIAGALRIGSRSGGYLFYGLIDEVRIYNRALSDDEIKIIYEATK